MLIGKSVRLRIAEPQDAALLAGWFADPEYLGAFYNVWPESVRDWEQSLSKDIDVTEKCTMVIERSDTGEAVGTMGYYQPLHAPPVPGTRDLVSGAPLGEAAGDRDAGGLRGREPPLRCAPCRPDLRNRRRRERRLMPSC